jgi:hypothetical protein
MIIITVLFIQGMVCAFLCTFIAEEKHYSPGKWFALGFFFGVLALIAAAGLPESRGWKEFRQFCNGKSFSEIKKMYLFANTYDLPVHHPDYKPK